MHPREVREAPLKPLSSQCSIFLEQCGFKNLLFPSPIPPPKPSRARLCVAEANMVTGVSLTGGILVGIHNRLLE